MAILYLPQQDMSPHQVEVRKSLGPHTMCTDSRTTASAPMRIAIMRERERERWEYLLVPYSNFQWKHNRLSLFCTLFSIKIKIAAVHTCRFGSRFQRTQNAENPYDSSIQRPNQLGRTSSGCGMNGTRMMNGSMGLSE